MVTVGICGWLGGFGTVISPKQSKRVMLQVCTQISMIFRSLTVAVQITLLLLSMAITASSASSLRAKRGLPLVNQVVGWIVLGNSPSLLFHQLG